MLAKILVVLPALATIASGATHTVIVGKTGLVYTPSELTAAVGDQVNFVFGAINHTVSQSTFAIPCEQSSPGFDSGYLPAGMDATMSPEYSITIETMDPIWYFCKQQTHCAGGMVGSINAPSSGNTFATFMATAKMYNGTVPLPASVVMSGSGAMAVGAPSTIAVAAAASTMGASSSMMMSPAATGTTAAPAASKPAAANSLKVSASALAIVGALALFL
ncbi:hypothetical protein RQP46_000619 [Phenoliferia psychrophenolica]